MRPGSIESKRPTEPVPRVRQTVPSPHPPPLCIATRSAPLRVARLSYPPTLPSTLHPRTSRNELIRQSDEGRATACMYTYTYRCLTKRGVIPSRRFTITKEM